MRVVAFLRAINVTGRFIKMEALRAHFEALKLADVETFINSGNVIFSSSAKNVAALEAKIEKHLESSLGFAAETFLRSSDALARIAAHKPFTAAQIKTARDVNVGFVKAPLTAQQQSTLMSLQNELDDFHVPAYEGAREVYWLARVSQHESKFSNAVFERKLKTVATWRRMSTIHNLLEKHF
ncbi:MAG: DUF1697 domain-containing protein [Burkholderiaceae bacterium]